MPAPMVPRPMTPMARNSREDCSGTGVVMAAILPRPPRVGSGPGHCRFTPRETRDRALPGRLRRPPGRPPPDGHAAADDEERRVGPGAQRRGLVQAAELDVT